MAIKNLSFGGDEEGRLKELIAERLRPGAVREDVDARLWDLFGEHWAIMFTDLAGFSIGVEKYGITRFMQNIYESQRIFAPVIKAHDGWLFEIVGDSMLMLFHNADKALGCALEMQHTTDTYNAAYDEADQIHVCIGLGTGQILKIGNHRVFGQQINAAAKLGEDTAKAGEILCTGQFRQAVTPDDNISFSAMDGHPESAESAHQIHYKT